MKKESLIRKMNNAFLVLFQTALPLETEKQGEVAWKGNLHRRCSKLLKSFTQQPQVFITSYTEKLNKKQGLLDELCKNYYLLPSTPQAVSAHIFGYHDFIISLSCTLYGSRACINASGIRELIKYIIELVSTPHNVVTRDGSDSTSKF